MEITGGFNIIIIIFLYFLSVATMSKIAQKEEIAGSSFLVLIPPLYFFRLTGHFSIHLIIFILFGFIYKFFYQSFGDIYLFRYIFLLPLFFSLSFILNRLRAPQSFLIFLFIPPFFGLIFLLLYLAFFYKVEFKENSKEKIYYKKNQESFKVQNYNTNIRENSDIQWKSKSEIVLNIQ